jgi:hypothetical protein
LPLLLDNILVSPSLVKNLISIRSLTRDKNVTVEFDPFGFSVKDLSTRMEILRCNSHGELYPLAASSPEAYVARGAPTADLWHQRLGHPGRNALHKTLSQLEFVPTKCCHPLVKLFSWANILDCPFLLQSLLVPFQTVHFDVWTSPIVSCFGFKSYLVLIDAFTHYVWTFPLHAKSEVLQCLLHFHAYVRT